MKHPTNYKVGVSSPGRTVQSDWGWELNVIAKHGCYLQHMAPCDIEAFIAAANKLIPPGVPVTGHGLLQLWVAAFIKLPKPVQAWVQGLLGQQASSRQPLTAAGYSAAVQALAQNMGKGDGWADDQLTTGRQHLLLGPITFFKKKLGGVQLGEQQGRRRRAPPGRPNTGGVVQKPSPLRHQEFARAVGQLGAIRKFLAGHAGANGR